MKKLLCILFLLAMVLGSNAALISFTATNSYGEPDTNYFLIIPITTINTGDGSFRTTGLPRRVYPDTNGNVLTNLMQNNWEITNRFFDYCIRTPLDSGPTIYPAGSLVISSAANGLGTFVTQTITYGGTNGTITLNQVTNGLGFLPLAQTNLPTLTNGFIGFVDATNAASSVTNGYSTLTTTNPAQVLYTNSLPGLTNGFIHLSDVTNVVGASGITNAYGTNLTTVLVSGQRVYIPTNSDPAGAAATVGLNATNNVYAVSNLLQSQIVAGSVSASTATNIAAYQARIATNGLSTLAYSNSAQVLYTNALPGLTNGFVGSNVTNGLAPIAYAQGLTNGFIKLLDATNVSASVAQSLTNGFIEKSDATNISAIQAQGVTNGFIKLLDATNVANARIAVSNAAVNALIAAKANTNAPTLYTPTLQGSVSFVNGAATAGMNATTLTFIPAPGSVPSIVLNDSNNAVLAQVVGKTFTGDGSGLTNTSSTNISGGALTTVTNVVTGARYVVNTNGAATALTVSNNLYFGNASGISGYVSNSFTTFGSLDFWMWDQDSGTYLNSAHLDNDSLQVRGDIVVLGPGLYTLGGFDVSGPYAEITNVAAIAQANISGLNVTNGITNQTLTASTLLRADANKKETSLANSAGILTNNGTAIGYDPAPVFNGVNITNISLATLGLTNAYGTNLTTVLVSGQRIYIPTNFDNAGGSNFLSGVKLAKTNDTSYGQSATNFTMLGNVAFGPAGQSTNIIGNSTNYIAFYNAGSGIATNGAMIWTGLVYTNWLTGAILTNNGSAWLLQTNGTTLYSLATASPIGTYSAVSGSAPVPTSVYTAAINDHMILLGYFSVTNLNQLITNTVIASTNGPFAKNNGAVTNLTLVWTPTSVIATQIFDNAVFGTGNSADAFGGDGRAILSGANNTVNDTSYAYIGGGEFNQINGSDLRNFGVIAGGEANFLNSQAGFIGGGASNNISAGHTGDVIGGGQANSIEGLGFGSILGGEFNTNRSQFSSILGGFSNIVYSPGTYSLAAGRNVAVTNSAVFAWSDGTPLTSTTNSQFDISATNGIYLTGPLRIAGSAMTNAGLYFPSNTFSLFGVTNGMGNFSYWQGSSNGVLVTIYLSNNVPYMKANWP